MFQALRSHRSQPSFSDGIGSRRSEWCANLPYSEVSHATIEARSVATIAIVDQKLRWRSSQAQPFHDLLRCRVRCRMARHFDVNDFSVSVPNHKRRREVSGIAPFGRTKIASPNVRCSAKNSRQLGDGPWCARMYLATVLAETRNPNLANSAWMRFGPQMTKRRSSSNSGGASSSHRTHAGQFQTVGFRLFSGAVDIGGCVMRGCHSLGAMATHTCHGIRSARSWKARAEARQITPFGTSMDASASEWLASSRPSGSW